MEAGADLPVLVWRFDPPALMISSGSLGGGIGTRHWIVNATVPMRYDRDDPDVHLTEVATGLGLGTAPGVGLLTGLDVNRMVDASDGGVSVTATVGLGLPCWAAAPEVEAPGPTPPVRPRPPVGTVNIVAWVPVRLSPGALVNAVATVTEAKAQAIWRAGIEATGTCTDAVCVACPADGTAEPYGGPRSVWGARLARASYGAVLDGARAWLAEPSAWSKGSAA
ncbi:adenosylcobinamide amidohydrolase [Rugosimonospora acidiphila]|uniref:Adenosylcobinamide amidohydrolase n=1 Tax=Rugosimonospora acidiphila TaxID=556531 RepID=A0ABP9SLZ0_9ACTN